MSKKFTIKIMYHYCFADSMRCGGSRLDQYYYFYKIQTKKKKNNNKWSIGNREGKFTNKSALRTSALKNFKGSSHVFLKKKIIKNYNTNELVSFHLFRMNSLHNCVPDPTLRGDSL